MKVGNILVFLISALILFLINGSINGIHESYNQGLLQVSQETPKFTIVENYSGVYLAVNNTLAVPIKVALYGHQVKISPDESATIPINNSVFKTHEIRITLTVENLSILFIERV
jgi:hypothetical protein